MKPKEKRSLERINAQSKRRLEIIQAAKTVFHQKGIENTKMTDIADAAEVGVASVYRYFNTKSELVIEVGIDYCKNIFSNIPLSDIDKRGIDQLSDLLDWLISLFYSEPDFISFLQQFDFFFVLKENYHPKLSEFETEVFNYLPRFTDVFEKGAKDGSIRADANNLDTITLIFRAFISLQQRVLTRDYILALDETFNREKQLAVLKEMILCYLSAK
jgi:AcrR family transcriptional regulator